MNRRGCPPTVPESLALLVLVACAPDRVTPPTPPSGASATAAAGASSGAGEAPTPPASAAAPGSAPDFPDLPSGALFVYREGTDAVAFTPPSKVTRLGAAKACSYELSDRGNMYSGREVQAAWEAAEVQRALAASTVFLAAEAAPGSKACGAPGCVAWTADCGGLCPAMTRDVAHLQRVLGVLLANARGVCGA